MVNFARPAGERARSAVLDQEVGDGQTLLDVLIARAAHFAQTGSSKDLYALLQYVSPPAQRIDAEFAPSPELEEAIEELRRRGPHCLEVFTSEAEAEEEPPEDPGYVKRDPEVGFYQRRLAGLRDRLEKSGHTPD